jgi:hypothetical protein
MEAPGVHRKRQLLPILQAKGHKKKIAATGPLVESGLKGKNRAGQIPHRAGAKKRQADNPLGNRMQAHDTKLLAHLHHDVEEGSAGLGDPVRNTIGDHDHIPFRQVPQLAAHDLRGSKFSRRFLLYVTRLPVINVAVPSTI